jgi:osmotically-inducible protein OsmY
MAVIYIVADGDEEGMILTAVMNRVRYATLGMAILGGAVACVMGPHKTDAERQADKETVARVQAALDGDTLLYAKHITVRADLGVVRLSGYVWDPPDLNEAQSIAAQVQGVTRVVNDLELQRNGVDNSQVTR